MSTASLPTTSGYAQQEPTKVPPWHGLVAWDILFNGLTTGLFLVTAVGELVLPERFTPLARVAYPAALLLLVLDLVLLVLDLGDRARFLYMLRVFKPGSPMSFGVWSLTLYALPLTVVVLLGLIPGGSGLEFVRKAALVLGIVPALASAAYKGVLLSTSAQPGWRDARWLGGSLTSGAVALGGAEFVILAYGLGQMYTLQVLRPLLGLLLVVESIPLCLMSAALLPTVRRIIPYRERLLVVALVGVGGALLPLILLLVGNAPALTLAAAVLLLLGNLVVRFALVQLPQRSV